MSATQIFKASPEVAVPMPRTLAEHLRRVPDPRLDRTKKHALGDVLTVATCAILCGYHSYYDMEDFCADYFGWLQQWLELSGGVPSHDTFRRVLGLVDPKHFGNVFRLWTEAVWRRVEEDHVAVDGKALRGSVDGLGSVQYIVNAWSAKRHLVLGQVKVQDKSNEITAIPRLLPTLDIRGALVSIDAIGCQTEIAGQIRSQGGHYLLALKDNNPRVREEMESFLLDAIAHGEAHVERFETVDKEHGRLERRVCHVSQRLGWFADRSKWKDLRCVVMVEATRTAKGVTGRPERRLYLCSKALTAQEALEATRAHWGVESLHWVLDMVLEEDRSRARDKTAAQNLALIRRMVYNVLRAERDAQATEKKVPRLKQLMRRAACKDEVRTRMMRVFGELRAADARPPQEQ